ncbi:MAG: hypothetical protein FD135_2622 [Comamonadaceae bacterium]|nr:MAG: hypothetical protein FD135_2622 [Comamonadaceae bacterium]
MAITLTHAASGTAVELPWQIEWVNEFSWDEFEQSAEYTTTGSLYIEEQRKQSGRPYELRSQQGYGWCTRNTVEQLYGLVNTPNIVMTLTIRGTPRTVTFDRKRGAMESFPATFYPDGSVAGDDPYVPTLRFIEL